MDRDQHHTAEGDQWEPVTDITTCSAAAQSDEEQNEIEAEISFQVNNDNPETAALSGTSNSPSPSSSMTTKQLQDYWRNEKRRCRQVKLLFEIPSTRIVEQYLSKYVLYKIIIIQTGSFDGNKTVIERRYSDFEKLHKNLLKDFNEEIEDVTFPKKCLTGNFTEEMINERKLAFRDYLGFLYSMKCVRRSKKFIDFLIRPEMEEAYGCLRGGQYTKALEILVQVVALQEKLTKHSPVLIVPTLCAVVVCHKDLENPASAYEYGEKALLRLQMHGGHRYYVPLLETMITLAYELGKDFLSLQEKLEESKAKRDQIKVFTLKELAVREYIQ
ncbi:sorting nexin-20 [Malaclemys terrapin pileata]|uniref:sorting nexin-20 n=1 Tax=Malaclemys terrapin pileata TaxID=2991368 RepID=UPI0023A79F4F|nr:sorting nexin-20 [Malaclemys terrapin pileata]XP_053904647.1 sorting nexin-20 [Malaclemys terrapin pileata]